MSRFGWVICCLQTKRPRFLRIDGNGDSWWVEHGCEAELFRTRETAERFIVANAIRHATAVEHFW